MNQTSRGKIGFPPKGKFRRWVFKNCPCDACVAERLEAAPPKQEVEK